MTSIEEESRKRKKKQDIRKAILLVIETAGVLTLAAIAPNVTQLFKSFGYDPRRR